MTKHRILVFLVITSLILVACGLFASPDSSSGTQEEDNQEQPVAPSEEPSPESPLSEEDVFPLTPDPINVTATLDTENTVTYEKGGYTTSIETESADGVTFRLDLFKDTFFVQDENGELTYDYEADISMTPVSAIDGLPFSQGYLAAVHLGPDGAKLLSSATLTMEIPGEYRPEDLIGFAADGTGEDFHLYPASFFSYDGKTYADFSVTHFSLYGVAPILLSEIEAQQGHPPVNPVSQDDQELAPLIAIETDDDLAPLLSKKQLELNKSYNRLIKDQIEKLDETKCERVTTVVQEYNGWISKVDRAGLREFFGRQIERDRNAMLYRLIDCIRPTCETCLNPQPGVKPDKTKVNSMLVMIEYARDLSSALKLGDEKNTNLWLVSSQCAQNAGLPKVQGGIAAEDWGGGSAPKVTCP